MLLDLDEIALRFKVLDDAAARFIAVKAFIFAAEAVDGGVVVHHADLLQTVTLADEKVVRVMRRGDFHAAALNSLSTYSSAMTGISRPTSGRISVLPTSSV